MTELLTEFQKPMKAQDYSKFADQLFKPQKGKAKQYLDARAVYVSPKLDGIRVLRNEIGLRSTGGAVTTRQEINTGALTCNGKPVPNWIVRELIDRLPYGCDGEVTAPGSKIFQDSATLVMSKMPPDAGPVEFDYHIFQCFADPEERYDERMFNLFQAIKRIPEVRILADDHMLLESPQGHKMNIYWIYQSVARTTEAIDSFFEKYVEMGYEGAMILFPEAPYHATLSKFSLKRKDFVDAEFEVVEVVQEHYGENLETVPKELWGEPKESGTFVCKGDGKIFPEGVTFGVGTGLTHEQKALLWEHRDLAIGRKITVKWLDCGIVDSPRHPVFQFKGGKAFTNLFRTDID